MMHKMTLASNTDMYVNCQVFAFGKIKQRDADCGGNMS